MSDFSELIDRSVFALHLPGLKASGRTSDRASDGVPDRDADDDSDSAPDCASDSAVDRGDGGQGSGFKGGSAAPSDATTAAPATVVPPVAAVASTPPPSEPYGGCGYRAVVFEQPHTGTVDGRGMVEPRRLVTVSCCLCSGVIRLPASGYGEMARRVEAAGWRYTPGRHLHDRAWCPHCRPNAGKAVA